VTSQWPQLQGELFSTGAKGHLIRPMFVHGLKRPKFIVLLRERWESSSPYVWVKIAPVPYFPLHPFPLSFPCPATPFSFSWNVFEILQSSIATQILLLFWVWIFSKRHKLCGVLDSNLCVTAFELPCMLCISAKPLMPRRPGYPPLIGRNVCQSMWLLR
jgi:hypothetical protein